MFCYQVLSLALMGSCYNTEESPSLEGRYVSYFAIEIYSDERYKECLGTFTVGTSINLKTLPRDGSASREKIEVPYAQRLTNIPNALLKTIAASKITSPIRNAIAFYENLGNASQILFTQYLKKYSNPVGQDTLQLECPEDFHDRRIKVAPSNTDISAINITLENGPGMFGPASFKFVLPAKNPESICKFLTILKDAISKTKGNRRMRSDFNLLAFEFISEICANILESSEKLFAHDSLKFGSKLSEEQSLWNEILRILFDVILLKTLPLKTTFSKCSELYSNSQEVGPSANPVPNTHTILLPFKFRSIMLSNILENGPTSFTITKSIFFNHHP